MRAVTVSVALPLEHVSLLFLFVSVLSAIWRLHVQVQRLMPDFPFSVVSRVHSLVTAVQVRDTPWTWLRTAETSQASL